MSDIGLIFKTFLLNYMDPTFPDTTILTYVSLPVHWWDLILMTLCVSIVQLSMLWFFDQLNMFLVLQ